MFLAGRVTLIYSIINNLHVHHFSFDKVLVKVIKEVIRIQRNFLWHGVTSWKGICWIIWSKVCKTKDEEGLGIKDVKVFKKALMSKGIWIFLNEEDPIWKGLLEHRYGNLNHYFWFNALHCRRSKCSLWWRDLIINKRLPNDS